MLRVGLTGKLGSGKSTVAAIFRDCGFHSLEADAIARALMQPGEPVHRAIVEHFGTDVVRPDGTLDRARLATLAFGEGRLAELTRLVHPPVIAEQERRSRAIFAQDHHAVVVVESALIFEADAGGTVRDWRQRFDRLVLVTAPDELAIERYLRRVLPAAASAEQRAAAERDARARLAQQLPDAVKAERCDFVIENAGSQQSLRARTLQVAEQLRAAAAASVPPASVPPA